MKTAVHTKETEKQESDPDQNGYVFNCIHENRPFTVNDVGRPVFVNHYYAGEAFIPVTNKKLIKLDECDVSTEISLRNTQLQGMEREFKEHSQNLWITQQPDETEKGQVQQHGNAALHSDLREDSQNSLEMTLISRKTEAIQKESNTNRGIHSKFVEHSQQSLGALNVGKSRVQETDQMTARHIPLTGYENFRQELQTYPVSRGPMTVQPTGVANGSSPTLLDLPNINTNLPPPLMPNPSSHYHQQHHNQVHQTELSNPGQVTNSEILKSIQSITEVMQQQLLLNSKTTEQGIVQTASLFQEMIKVQEKRDLDPALLAIPTFSEEAKDRPQCLDWVSRVKNVCDQSGRSFCQELINKVGILVQNFIRSLNKNITNNELTEKILQFFSDVLITFHALNKLRLIQQGAEEPIVNYNQCYQNLVERLEGCQLNSIRSTVAMELYLGSIIEPIWKSIWNTYFNSKHAPKTLGEAMQKAQDLHIKHLYAIGEDQDSVTSSSDALPEITVNEVTSREDRGWYKTKRDFREHLQNLQEISPQRREYSKRVTFNQKSRTRTANNSEYSDSSRNLRVSNNYSKEPENDKSNKQPSVIRGSFTQIMVNPMQLQDHEFTAWLDRLVEARKNRQKRRQRPYSNFRKPYNDGRQNGDTGSKPHLRNQIKPAQELEIQQIMDNFNCEYDDVVEAVDLYNLDVEGCTTA